MLERRWRQIYRHEMEQMEWQKPRLSAFVSESHKPTENVKVHHGKDSSLASQVVIIR